MMFMGEYIHSIDTKGRVMVPVKFRDKLGSTFVITKGLDGCLWVFPSDEWEEFSGKLTSLPVANKKSREFVRSFMAGANEVEIDKQGRALIPQNLRGHAHLDKDVAIVGVGKRVEIWDKATWEKDSAFDDMDELAEYMGELGFGI